MASEATRAAPHRAQRVRKGLLLFFFLLFPVVFNFLSPYLSLSGAMQGAVSGSLLFFKRRFASLITLGGWFPLPAR